MQFHVELSASRQTDMAQGEGIIVSSGLQQARQREEERDLTLIAHRPLGGGGVGGGWV